ncbi:MAG TPA: SMP-30/gluconolactonase/LRE family protein [Longimicrobiaceae bacterium]|nr:SMP-30/gluconolactonase/LRE family protein [Longimicrobiaceae bacterium]
MPELRRIVTALAAALLCAPASIHAQGAAPLPQRVASVGGFQLPESAQYDAARDVYLVGNINGHPTTKDGNGYVSRLRPDGTVESLGFIRGGRGGVVLHAPKGLLVVGDTLWVADIDAVRGFHLTSGAPLRSIDLSGVGAVFLNDLARGPDGALYVTDTGLRFGPTGPPTHPGPDRVFRVAPDGTVSTALEGTNLAAPNGIFWDEAGGRFLIGSLWGKTVLAWKPGEAAAQVAAEGAGGFDGISRLPDGRVVVASQDAEAVQVLDGTGLTTLFGGLSSPADIGVDTRRNRVLVPLVGEDRVEIWQLPEG